MSGVQFDAVFFGNLKKWKYEMLGNTDKLSWLCTTLLLSSMCFTVAAVADENTDPGDGEAENATLRSFGRAEYQS
jgi:hypothetical protein